MSLNNMEMFKAAAADRDVELMKELLSDRDVNDASQKKYICDAAFPAAVSRCRLIFGAAWRRPYLSVVQLLLHNGADPDAQRECIESSCRSKFPLHIAAADCDSDLVELLLQHGANVDVTDADGNTALHHSIVYRWNDVKSVVYVLLEKKADVNIVNRSGETPLYAAALRRMLEVVGMLLRYKANPNIGSPDTSPLAAACLKQDVKIVDMLLKHEADPNVASKHRFPLFIAVKYENTDIILSLLNTGANVNAVNHERRSVVSFAAEKLVTYSDYLDYYPSKEAMKKKLSIVRLLLQYGANFNTLMPCDNSPLYLAVRGLSGVCPETRVYRTFEELLHMMVEHGVTLLHSYASPHIVGYSNNKILTSLATFDAEHKFVVELFRAGATFPLIAFCCNAVAPRPPTVKSIGLCKAAVLAGYSPSVDELQQLQQETAATRNDTLQNLMNWLNEDGQQVPSLFGQCRVAIRRQLSAAAQYRTILPAIDKLQLPSIMKMYLKFDGAMTEVDLSVNE